MCLLGLRKDFFVGSSPPKDELFNGRTNSTRRWIENDRHKLLCNVVGTLVRVIVGVAVPVFVIVAN